MKIQRLELVGFKSFMDKVVLHFEDGVTAVVGPNGCGKSNIVDAIFWVMGDQSAKHLRGREMEDIIFSGTQDKPSSGMAEVSVILSTEGVVGQYGQFSEVAISRRLYRSGESEYLINKVPCRLKDVVEFFMDTGIGAKAYSIIEQGQIGKIVSQKPEERRSLIEEAAGITKFKSRKREAALKMEGTEQNLLRINDIISEIKRQIDSLERQARKAEKYKQIKEEIREIELIMASQDFKESSQKLKELEDQFKQCSEEQQRLSVEIQKNDSSLEKLKVELIEREKEVQMKQGKFYEKSQSIQEFESQKEIKKKEIENFKALYEKDSNDKEQLESKKSQLQKSMHNMEEALGNLNQEETKLRESLKKKELECESEKQKHDILNQKIESERSELFSLLNQEAQCHNTLSILDQRKKSADVKWERFLEEEENLNRELKNITQQKKDIGAVLIDVEVRKQNILESRNEKEETLKQSKNLLSQVSLKRDQIKEQFQSTSSRLQSFLEIEKSFEGYEQGSRTLLSNESFRNQKILATLVEIFDVEEKYEKALEAVLQERLKSLVVENRKTALELIEYLRQKEIGHSHFITRETTKEIPEQQNTLDPLWKKIKVKRAHGEIFFQHLLKDVYVVSNLNEALHLWDRAPYLYTFVTPDAEMVTKEGCIRGGKAKESVQGLLSQKREIKNLELSKKELENSSQTLEREVQQLFQTLEDLEKEIEGLTQKFHEEEVSKTGFTKDMSKSDEDSDRIQEEKEILLFEKEQQALLKKEIIEELNKEKNNKILLEEKKKAKEASLETAKLTCQRVLKDLEEKKKYVHEIKLQEVSLKEKKNALDRQKEHLCQNSRVLGQEIQEKMQALKLSLERQKNVECEIQDVHLNLEKSIKELEEFKNTLSSFRSHFDADQGRLRTLDEDVRKLRLNLSQVETLCHQKNLEISQIQMTLKHGKEQIHERYLIDLEMVIHRYEGKQITPQDKQRCADLKEKSQRMGEVNLTAIQEFDELKNRYQTLETQRQDLLQSLESLKKTIEKINRVTRQRFEETFEVVNKNFKRVFPLLFNGGQAELVLTEPNNLLESGVDIMAKPPGKKLQNMNLLSGGEKALTAISLILAIFLMKPSPFCLLDEVDAPLDDANVERFNEMIRKMTSHSQFIVITHNKKTMERADILYGITMEQPGVSNIISVKLEKAIQMVRSQKGSSSQKEVSV